MGATKLYVRGTANSPTNAKEAVKVVSKDFNKLIDELEGNSTESIALAVDTISEKTSGSGVTIDGVLLKDGGIQLSTGCVEYTATVPITAAQFNGMYASPIVLAEALGTEYALDFVSAVLIINDATDYAAGGAITVNYSGGAAVSTTLAATFLTGNGDKVWNLQKLNAANGYTMPVNTDLVLTNASQAFTTGTGTGICYITYKVYTTGL